MYISKTGGVIGTASKTRALPFRQTGTIPAVRRIVLTMQQAGIFPIVVVTGADEFELRYQLTKDHIILLEAEDPNENYLIDTVKAGIRYLEEKCENVLFTPVNAPFFTADTIVRMLNQDGELVTPSYHGTPGHPVLIRDCVKQEILAYSGEEGLRGAIRLLGDRRKNVEVKDLGILSLSPSDENLPMLSDTHTRSLLHPSIEISLGNENLFFNNRLKLLLFLIGDLKNVKLACEAMAISKGKAWDMINKLEDQLGYTVVARQQGGKRGGKTSLTDAGEAFLMRWQQYEEEVYQFSQDRYRKIFD